MRAAGRRRPARAGSRPSRNATTANHSYGTAADLGIDKTVVAAVDASIWQALFDGHFRLAVQCDTCGRWLTASESKRAHRGPRCRAKAASI
jgi:hypothetical protein